MDDYTFEELELIEYAINVAIWELGSGTQEKEKALEKLADKIGRDKARKQN